MSQSIESDPIDFHTFCLGVYGSHHNIFVAKQYPSPKCDCFWQKQNYVLKPDQLPPDAIPIEPFAN